MNRDTSNREVSVGVWANWRFYFFILFHFLKLDILIHLSQCLTDEVERNRVDRDTQAMR